MNFNSKDEETRKVFIDELLECIEEVSSLSFKGIVQWPRTAGLEGIYLFSD